MVDNTFGAAGNAADSVDTNTPLTALRLAEERACAGYLAARKAMVWMAGRAASLRQLADEQPKRADYRAAAANALSAYSHAAQRARLAEHAWQRAQYRPDAMWTATDGRRPRQLAAVTGEAA